MAIGPIRATPECPGNRISEFSPARINDFRDCPEYFYRRHIGRERGAARFSRGMLRGDATHKALALHFNARSDGEILDATPDQLAERFLPRHRYEQQNLLAEWHEDVKEVASLIRRGMQCVPAGSEVLAVERVFSYVMPTGSPVPGAVLCGKVDLVIRRRDTLEHIEFKTGKAGADLVQEVICRIGVCHAYRGAGVPVLSTVLQLSAGERYELDGDPEAKITILREISETIRQVWTATVWEPRAGVRCSYCEYADTLCSLKGEWAKRTRREQPS